VKHGNNHKTQTQQNGTPRNKQCAMTSRLSSSVE